MKVRSKLKKMNWQDVTMEQLSSHWNMGVNKMPNPLDFRFARYMNAFAYGDLAGEGIDVRCQYADEVVDIFSNNLHSTDIELKLNKLGWKTTNWDDFTLNMSKGGDLVQFDICEKDEAAYITMTITDKYAKECSNVIEEYYEQAETTI